jgi:hypothetical protein
MAREVPVFISYARSDGEKHAQELQLPSLCIPGGSQTRGDDARDDPSRTEPSLGPSAAKADARDCRQSLRQRSAAGALAAARNRTDLPAQEESRSAGNPGWTSLATLPAAMDRGTHQCLVGELPTFGRALRPFADNLWCFFSYRLLHDRLTESCAIASRRFVGSASLNCSEGFHGPTCQPRSSAVMNCTGVLQLCKLYSKSRFVGCIRLVDATPSECKSAVKRWCCYEIREVGAFCDR